LRATLQVNSYTSMKQAILLLLLASSVFANGQSLKEALFSGKLKNEAGTVIRKGDDLASKMDTARKAPAEEAAKTAAAAPANTTSETLSLRLIPVLPILLQQVMKPPIPALQKQQQPLRLLCLKPLRPRTIMGCGKRT
jgi:hypothetical protein